MSVYAETIISASVLSTLVVVFFIYLKLIDIFIELKKGHEVIIYTTGVIGGTVRDGRDVN